jgi:hypothetical protein
LVTVELAGEPPGVGEELAFSVGIALLLFVFEPEPLLMLERHEERAKKPAMSTATVVGFIIVLTPVAMRLSSNVIALLNQIEDFTRHSGSQNF